MRRFLIKVILYFLICFGLIIGIYFFGALKNEPYVDAFYRRFTKHHSGSVILGTSRAAQGIEPSVLNKSLGGDFYNFSFTMLMSSFELSYFKAIQAKTSWADYDPTRMTIIAVDPWSIREVLSLGPAEERIEDEYLYSYTSKWSYFRPNFKYLFNEKVHLSGLFATRERYVNEFGRYVIPFDTTYLINNYEKRVEEILQVYRERPRFRDSKISEYRLNSLVQIIDYCSQFGEVYLLRIPVSLEMRNLENELHAGFDDLMDEICANHKIDYLNFIQESANYQTVDGNHIWNGDVERFSRELSKQIMLKRNSSNF
ncbi:MAG: hypothetical protein COW03_09420 [Cytophagales bacterium CG12_big_fil_rev_8_21_14_0_65_40_12]|nr:MAG: hypothetical protein COW03_09420 [Cytophagales bacterium CG12_big_fil_rev_8_21_14_0_65_40_12]PIW05533.1 MAG: hypothetical protein COW40_03540 [Cytophagales bacterium CG17_big_fil_post_rev_8_21_14_2_50_40_13]